MRVPGGDAVQRLWSVPDDGGLTIVEVENDSPLPIACAFTRDDLRTDPPTGRRPGRGHRTATDHHRAADRPPGVGARRPRSCRASGRAAARRPALGRGGGARLGHRQRAGQPSRPPERCAAGGRRHRTLRAAARRASRPVPRTRSASCSGLASWCGCTSRSATMVAEVASAAEELARQPGWEADVALAAAAPSARRGR